MGVYSEYTANGVSVHRVTTHYQCVIEILAETHCHLASINQLGQVVQNQCSYRVKPTGSVYWRMHSCGIDLFSHESMCTSRIQMSKGSGYFILGLGHPLRILISKCS